MADKTIHATISESGESTFAVSIEVSGHTLKGDEPVEAGGLNLGPAPYDLLTAALGECTAMTVRWYAEQKRWPLNRVEVHISHAKQLVDGVLKDVFDKHVTLHGDALTEEQRNKLIEIATKCPVHRTLQSDIVIHTS